ncbi:hypothetical protein [Bradyrhizobium sp. AZCC 2289]|uniref:hypothetical protein n=1 Tax=Bradyrhizobium sp. AZCC 2289 TaxID=3117026 RepID=UPI002FEF766F
MSNIIAFPGSSPKRPIAMAAGTSRMSRVELDQEPEIPARDEAETITLRNRNLRDARKDAWRQAEVIREYWRARLDMERAIADVQNHDLPEGNYHPRHDDPNEDLRLLANWRQALARQLLTPAPYASAVAWKRAALKSGQHEYTDVKTERIERVIAADVAWLAAHPVRHDNREAIAHRREFKAAMRQRIKDVAASRDLSEEEIKPALTLKHHEIAKFTEKYGVNVEWLLEGKGRIFQKDPIRLSPNSSGAEFVAVVRTLPEAQQRKIEAVVDRFLAERDQ